MNLLITGATGFVGRNLLLRALKEPTFSAIILPVRDKTKLLRQLHHEGIKTLPEHVHLCSVKNNTWDLDSSPLPDLVIHCAGLTFSHQKEPYFKTHVEGTLQLFAQLPSHTRFIVLSSLSAAGPTPLSYSQRELYHKEQPVSWYGKSKLAMEQALQEKYPNRLLIVRPPMILGPRDTATLPLFKMVASPLRVKPGFQTKTYSWIAVEDLNDALLTAAKSDWKNSTSSKPYFICHSQTITDFELLQTVALVLKKRGFTLPLPHRILQLLGVMIQYIPLLHQPLQSLGPDRIKEILPGRWVSNGALFEKDFQWQAQKNLRETLEKTAAWLHHFS